MKCETSQLTWLVDEQNENVPKDDDEKGEQVFSCLSEL